MSERHSIMSPAMRLLLYVTAVLLITGAVMAVHALFGADQARVTFGYLLGLWAGWVCWGRKR